MASYKTEPSQGVDIEDIGEGMSFTQCPMGVIRNQNLSYADLGVYVRLLSLPKEFRFTIEGFVMWYANQETAKASLKRLQKLGLISIERIRNAKGQTQGTHIRVYRPQWEIPNEIYSKRKEKPNE